MPRLEHIQDARIEIAKAAAARWRERTADRRSAAELIRRGGPGAADSPEAVANFERRSRVVAAKAARALGAPPPRSFLERLIGADDLARAPRTQEEQRAGVPVARIALINGPGRDPTGFGTGFMIAPRLLMTNNHVLASRGDASGVGANFGHEFDGGAVRAGEIFELDPDAFFITDQRLDYTIVAVKPTSLNGSHLSDYGVHRLIEQTGKLLIGHPVSIIQHPDGGPKRYAVTENEVVDRLPDFLHYRTDTKPGSSGSPCFNLLWEIVALHHSGVPRMRGDTILNDFGEPWDPSEGDEAIDWVANEGVRVSRILAAVRSAALADPAQVALRDTIFAPPPPIEVAPLPAVADVLGAAPSPATVTPMPAAIGPTVIHVHSPANFYVINPAPAQNGGLEPAGPERAALVAREKALRFDPEYGRRRGYDPFFLRGFEVPLPSVRTSRARELVAGRSGEPLILDYHHFSLAMNRSWLLQMWSAVNVDYSPEVRWNIKREEFGSETWISDPRISDALQIEDEELYRPAKKFDRGHIVRREDNVWGATREEVEFANSDTFHWTNCTPQHEGFNRSNMSGIWGKLENHIREQAGAVDDRLILFASPVLNQERAIPHDFGGGRFRVPLDFWKVVVVAEQDEERREAKLRSYGFMLVQERAIDVHGLERLPAEERFEVGEFVEEQCSLAEIETVAGVAFPEVVRRADVLADRRGNRTRRRLESLEDLVVRAEK